MNDALRKLERLAQEQYKPGQKIIVTVGNSVSLQEIMRETWHVQKVLLMGPAKAIQIGRNVANRYRGVLEKMGILDARDFITEKIEDSFSAYPIDVKWKGMTINDE